MTPLARGILSSAKLGVANFAKYFMAKFNPSYGIEVPDNATLDLTNDFSACAWVYTNNRTVDQYIMSKFLVTGSQRSWFINTRDVDGRIVFGHSVDGSAVTFFSTTLVVPLNTKTLVHFRLTSGTLYIGINGASEQSVAKGACFSGSAPIEIGKIISSIFDDDFDITQPMLFNSGSSLANFLTIYNGGMPCKYSLITPLITDDAVMAFELSSNDDTLTDLSGTGNDGAFVGGSFVDGHLATWKIGPEVTSFNSFNFDTSEGVSAAHSASLSLTSNFSGGAWVYPIDRSTFQRVISKNDAGTNNRQWLFNLNTSGNLYFETSAIGSGSSMGKTSVAVVPLNEWSYVHFRVTGGNVYLGLNGDAEEAITQGGIFTGTAPVEIGSINNSVNFSSDFNITQPMLFNVASSAANFITIYNSGKPLLYSLIAPSITNDAVLAFEMSSNDSSLTDLSGNSNNGTANGGVTADGIVKEWQIV